jgi:hypothetical protein
MAFKTYIYESDRNTSYKIRLDSDQAVLSGGTLAGATTEGFHVKAQKPNRAFGLNPRHIVLKRTTGPAEGERSFFTRLAICTDARWDALVEGSVVTVNAVNYVIDRKEPESRR